MISTPRLYRKYHIPRLWLYYKSHELKVVKKIVGGRAVNFYDEKQVIRLRKKHGR